MKLFFIRHGQTVDNVDDVYSGQRETPLTDHGRQQAKDAVAEIKPLGINHIFASPLQRAQDTAGIIAEGIGCPASNIQTTPDLIEINVGSLTGHPQNSPHANVYRVAPNDPTLETVDQVTARLKHLLGTLPADGNVMLVGHAGSGRILKSILTGTAIDDIPELPNCRVFELPLPKQENVK